MGFGKAQFNAFYGEQIGGVEALRANDSGEELRSAAQPLGSINT